MSFNTFESTFLIVNVDWLWVVYGSGDFQYKLDVVLLAPVSYSLFLSVLIQLRSA